MQKKIQETLTNFPNEFTEVPVPQEIPAPKKIQIKDSQEIKKEKLIEKSPKILPKVKEKAKPVEVKVYNNPEDYNCRIEAVKNKWEDKLKKDSEEASPVVETTLKRLERILGDRAKGENLQDFLDNLLQRKISRLSDENVITLFQERIAARKTLSGIEEEIKEETKEDVPFFELFDCDFCTLKFPTREICEEHMKIHDVKIQFFCEDCNEEFPVLRLKKKSQCDLHKKIDLQILRLDVGF